MIRAIESLAFWSCLGLSWAGAPDAAERIYAAAHRVAVRCRR